MTVASLLELIKRDVGSGDYFYIVVFYMVPAYRAEWGATDEQIPVAGAHLIGPFDEHPDELDAANILDKGGSPPYVVHTISGGSEPNASRMLAGAADLGAGATYPFELYSFPSYDGWKPLKPITRT